MISVIISVYKALDNLELIFLGLERQSFKDFEVIVAEDDNATETVDFLEKARKSYSFPIQHVSQEDKGFRKCRILNQALIIAKGEKVVFLDGDCIPHHHLLKEYYNYITDNTVCCGRRMMLSESFTRKLKQAKKLNSLTLLNIISSQPKKISRALYLPFLSKINNRYWILGCNWGIMKKDIFLINGFDMDYEIIGIGEDIDLDWRLELNGVQRKKVTQSCIVYHLYHKERYDATTIAPNQKMLLDKQKLGYFYCQNGIQQIM